MSLEREDLAALLTEIPGPQSLLLAQRLAQVECPDTTYLSADFPIFWQRASEANVWDVDGNRFVDVTGAFGVSVLGHSNAEVMEALRRQSELLIHGMGDVHPSALKVKLAERLTTLAGKGITTALFGLSGSDAIESALKTSALATGKPGVLAFEGGYHGLGYGSLGLTWRNDFRAPFLQQLNPHVQHVRFPDARAVLQGDGAARLEASKVLNEVEARIRSHSDLGAILVEPVQGRGGVLVPHVSFLQGLREMSQRHGLLLIVDEVFTGLGRTGKWFACEHSNVVPDLLCVGKALGGGLPLSACLGTADVMAVWEKSRGEARQTSTFLGHPLACATSLATLEILQREDWPSKNAQREHGLRKRFSSLMKCPGVHQVRGLGVMWGMELVDTRSQADATRTFAIIKHAMRHGLLLLGAGTHKNVIQWTAPYTLSEEQEEFAFAVLEKALKSIPPTGPRRSAPKVPKVQAEYLGDKIKTWIENAPPGQSCFDEDPKVAYGLTDAESLKLEQKFQELALELFAHHYERIPAYAAFCRLSGVTPKSVQCASEVPPLPVEAYKRERLATFSAAESALEFHTSGTTEVSVGRILMQDTTLYELSSERSFRYHVLPDKERIRMLSIVPEWKDNPHSSLGFMLEHIRRHCGTRSSGVFVCHDRILHKEIQQFLEQCQNDGEEVCLLGTTLAWLQLFQLLEGWNIELPAGSRLFDTGGYKGKQQGISRQDFMRQVELRLGIPGHFVVSEYGMTELFSQYYTLDLRRSLLGEDLTSPSDLWSSPFWLRARLVDSQTNLCKRPATAGDLGLLSHHDLANLGTPSHILTADLGRPVRGSFQLLGRCPSADLRGCGLAQEDLVGVEGRA